MVRRLLTLAILFLFAHSASAEVKQIQPWLGVEIDSASQKDGILIKRVIPSTPAERAGFQGGDLLQGIDKEKIKSREELMAILRNKGVGTSVKVLFSRAGKADFKTLRLEALPNMLDLAKASLIKKPAPPFALQSLDQKKTYKNEDFKGKAYILEFWATWCPACLAAGPLIDAWAKKHPNIPVIGISDEDPALIANFVKQEKFRYLQTVDFEGRVQGAYGMGSIPAFILVDKDGVVNDLTVGAGDYLQALLKKAEAL